jgi:hypothetical protein
MCVICFEFFLIDETRNEKRERISRHAELKRMQTEEYISEKFRRKTICLIFLFTKLQLFPSSSSVLSIIFYFEQKNYNMRKIFIILKNMLLCFNGQEKSFAELIETKEKFLPKNGKFLCSGCQKTNKI